MKDFLKNIGYLLIVAGAVLLFIYRSLNRIDNTHYLIAAILEISGLIIFILTNRFIKDEKESEEGKKKQGTRSRNIKTRESHL